MWIPCKDSKSQIKLSPSQQRCPSHPALAHHTSLPPPFTAHTPQHPGCSHPVALGLTGEGGRPLDFFFNSPVIAACRESWQSLRYIMWFHSAKGFNNSVGYGVQDCGVTEQGARCQGRRDAETPAELFFLSLSLSLSLSWSFTKYQCGCTSSEIRSTGLF